MQLSELNGFLDLFARDELENLVNSTSPREWLSGYVERHYNNSAEGEPAFISVSMSIESMILHDSAIGEIAVTGQISDELAHAISDWAVQDWDCNAMVRSLIIRASKETLKLPAPLFNFVESTLRMENTTPKSKDSRYYKIRSRNIFGAMDLIVLTNKKYGFGMTPTKGSETQIESCACDLLVEATSGTSWAAITNYAADEIYRARFRLWTELRIGMLLKDLRNTGKILNGKGALLLLEKLDQYPNSAPSGRKFRT